MYEKYTGFPAADYGEENNRNTNRKNTVSNKPRSGNSSRSGASGNRSASNREMSAYNHSGSRSTNTFSYSGNSRGNGSANRSARAAARRRKQRRQRLLAICAGAAVLLGLLAVTITMIVRSVSDKDNTPTVMNPVTDVFRDNIYINSTLVTGKTIDEARTLLSEGIDYTINNISITISHDSLSQSAVITGTDMAASSDLEEVLLTALNGDSNNAYNTTILVDNDALDARLEEISQTLASAATDATLKVEYDDDGKPVFTYLDGVSGYALDLVSTEAQIQELLNSRNYQTTITPVLTTQEPTTTVEDIKAHTTLLATFTTTYDSKGTAEDTQEQRDIMIPNRAFNVQKGADLLNGVVIKPGKTFSFNGTVGDRNEENGWKQANGIFGGDRFTLQYGGGICQVSTTLYDALLRCYPNIEIVKRRQHSIPSSYVELGLDATVDTGHIDFKFKNVTEYPLYIFAYTSQNKKSSSRKRDITIAIYGEALPEGVTYVPRSVSIEELLPGEPIITEDKKQPVGYERITAAARNGYIVEVYLDKYVNGKLDSSELLYTDTYAAITEKKTVGTAVTVTPTPYVNPEDRP